MRIIFLLFAFCFTAYAYSEENFTLDREAEPSAFIYGCINAVTGSFLDTETDISISGPEPLSFTRFYNSAVTRQTGLLGLGTSLNFPIDVGPRGSKKRVITIFIEEVGGSFIRYCSRDESFWYYADPALPSHGLTNCGSGELSARSNLKLTKLLAVKKKKHDKSWAWDVFLPDGSKRHYFENGHLSYEIKPNGHRIQQIKKPIKLPLKRVVRIRATKAISEK